MPGQYPASYYTLAKSPLNLDDEEINSYLCSLTFEISE